MSKEAIAEKALKNHPTADAVFITGDGQAFLSENYARMHARDRKLSVTKYDRTAAGDLKAAEAKVKAAEAKVKAVEAKVKAVEAKAKATDVKDAQEVKPAATKAAKKTKK